MSDPLPPQPASELLVSCPGWMYVAGPDEAGDAACWAQLVCPECGAVRSEGTCRCGEGTEQGSASRPK